MSYYGSYSNKGTLRYRSELLIRVNVPVLLHQSLLVYIYESSDAVVDAIDQLQSGQLFDWIGLAAGRLVK